MAAVSTTTIGVLMHPFVRLSRNCLGQIVDPIRMVRGFVRFRSYFSDWRRYSRMTNAETLKLVNAVPQLHERTYTTPFDAHYFYVNGWAMRRIANQPISLHVDIASQTIFANLLSATVPVLFVDYRPLNASLSGLSTMGGNLLQLPFANGSINSLSCLHVIEHIGLGRYGDPLDPHGTRKATAELIRVLKPGGNLYVATPVGRPRLCFNAHRIHTAQTICNYFSELELIEFSGVDDENNFMEQVHLATFDDCEYACGFFRFARQEK